MTKWPRGPLSFFRGLALQDHGREKLLPTRKICLGKRFGPSGASMDTEIEPVDEGWRNWRVTTIMSREPSTEASHWFGLVSAFATAPLVVIGHHFTTVQAQEHPEPVQARHSSRAHRTAGPAIWEFGASQLSTDCTKLNDMLGPGLCGSVRLPLLANRSQQRFATWALLSRRKAALGPDSA